MNEHDPLWYGWSLVSQVAYRVALGIAAGLTIYLIMVMKGIA